MHFYFPAYFVIPITIWLFSKRSEFLFLLMVAFIPFTGTSVFRIELPQFEAQGMRVSQFVGFFWLLRVSIDYVLKGRIQFLRPAKFFMLALIGVILVVGMSLLVPVMENGERNILNAYGKGLVMYAEEISFEFRLQYLTQALYAIFGCLISLFIVLKIQDRASIERAIRVYLLSTLFVVCWAMLEWFCYYSGLPYPSWLFNQNSGNAGSPMTLHGTIRIISVALEPSILSQQLLTTIPFLFWGIYFDRPLFSRFRDQALMALIIFTLLITISTTSYVGLFLLFFLINFELFLLGRIKKWWAILQIGLFFLIPIVAGILSFHVLYKLGTYSGIERFKSLSFAWQYFTEYPILGLGWGVFPSWDLVLCILAGTGVIGFLVFFGMIAKLIRGLYHIRKSSTRTLTTSVLDALIILLLASEISGFIYHSQYFWFILGLTASTLCVLRSELATLNDQVR